MVLGLILGILYLFSDAIYWAKWIASFVAIKLWKKFRRSRFDLYEFETAKDPEKLAILAPKEERILDSPFPEEHLQDADDEVFMYGVNSSGQSLLVRVSRLPQDDAEAWIFLRLADGRRYELRDRAGHQRNYGGHCTSFSCGGLKMHSLVPMRRWRVNFCGMLRESSKKNEDVEKEVFVKFTFLWTASSDPYDSSYEFGTRSAANAMAREKWTSPLPQIEKVSDALNFYQQSGVMSGIISIEDQPDEEMYLFGERIRYLGKLPTAQDIEFKNVLGVTPKSGLVIHLGRASVTNTFQNLHHGFIVHPDGHNRVIKDGMIITKMPGKGESEGELQATFKVGNKYSAGTKEYEIHGKFSGEDVRHLSEKRRNGHQQLIEIEFEVNGLQGRGFVIHGKISRRPEMRPRKILPSLSSAKQLTVPFSDEACQLPELTGGKGSSLGMLTKLSSQKNSEFTVPKGIVVTTAAYQEFLTPDIRDKIETMKDIVYGNTKGNVHEAHKIVQSAIERAYLSDKIAKDIEDKLGKIFGGHINRLKFAVRSSATGEDTDQMSAAGQMDTYLGVRGLKEIFTAVKKCWASQFGPVATEYKRQNGQVLNSPMAVVIQEMVECEAAGVLFTCDPLSNNPSVAVITGNYGLGESVVSGAEDPDMIVLKKLPTKEVEIKSVTVGLKQHRIVMTDKKDTEDAETVVTEDIPEDKRRECCISQDMIMKLGKLSLEIEDYFKSPRDIEWGIKNNVIYILQSRPVTTSAAASDNEIKHELDGPMRCEGDFFSICNVSEVMPGAMSPLGLDGMGKFVTAAFQKQALRERQKNGFQQQNYFFSGFIIPFYNRVAMSVTDLVTRVAGIESTTSKSVMVAFFGRVLDDPELVIQSKYRMGAKVNKNLAYYIKNFKNLFFSVGGVEELRKYIFSYQNPALSAKTSQEIFDLVMTVCSIIVQPFTTHVLNTESSSLWNMYLLRVLEKANGSIDNNVYSDLAKLLSSSSTEEAGVESADVPSGMQELARCIVKDIGAENFKSKTTEEARNWLETTPCTAGQKYRQFLQKHGHRCLKEFDLHSITWGINPNPLVQLLQNMVGSCESMKVKKEKTLSELFSELSVPLDMKSKLLLRFILPFCHRGVRTREKCKSIVIKSMDNIRRGFRHLSKAMVAEGYLPDPDLLFFLGFDEIYELLQTRNPALISRANHRRKLLPTHDSYVFPEIWRGRPIPLNEDEDKYEYVADLTMKGIPVSQGIARGYARVAHNLDEAASLKRGEILITHSTDIGWTPYFPILSGVVTEIGGLVSHGAVVSREYGLPCVVGIPGASKKFMTGDYVLLDGNKGIIQRLTPPE